MKDFIQILNKKAFEKIQGAEYNNYRDKNDEGPDPITVYYEIPLNSQASWESLRDEIFPKFIRFLAAKAIHRVRAPDTVVVIFFDHTCFLIAGQGFIEIYREIEGLDEGAYKTRIEPWLKQE